MGPANPEMQGPHSESSASKDLGHLFSPLLRFIEDLLWYANWLVWLIIKKALVISIYIQEPGLLLPKYDWLSFPSLGSMNSLFI